MSLFAGKIGALCAGAGFLLASPAWCEAPGGQASWTANDAMLVFFQAAQEISERAIVPTTVPEVAQGALKCYLRALDPYSDYLTAEESAAWREAGRGNYGGIGMELYSDAAGLWRCLPLPDSPAERAGVEEGDQLCAIDDVPIATQKNVYAWGSAIRGLPGTTVTLAVARGTLTNLQVRVRREQVQARSIVATTNGMHHVRILTFAAGTLAEISNALAGAKSAVLDLRGNSGGSLAAGIEAARLFLPEGKPVITIRTRAGEQPFVSRGNAPFTNLPLVIWQDERTASAAEVFIAALVQNQRAGAVGRRTFGKGVTQKTTELMDGSALLLSDGLLLPPCGDSYNQIGLAPAVEVPGTHPEAWWAATLKYKEALNTGGNQ